MSPLRMSRSKWASASFPPWAWLSLRVLTDTGRVSGCSAEVASRTVAGAGAAGAAETGAAASRSSGSFRPAESIATPPCSVNQTPGPFAAGSKGGPHASPCGRTHFRLSSRRLPGKRDPVLRRSPAHPLLEVLGGGPEGEVEELVLVHLRVRIEHVPPLDLLP